MKILSHYPLVLPSKKKKIHDPRTFSKPFPTKTKPSKCLNKEKKTGKEKQKKRGGKKAKGKRRGYRKTFSEFGIRNEA